MTRDTVPLLQRPIVQYGIGLLVHLLFLLVLLSTPTSRANLQLPEGRYAENLWRGTDVLTYVLPARNFLEHGVFGNGLAPDYHRTVGFPFYLSLLMSAFGSHWLIGHFFVMAALSASIYPSLAKASQLLFPGGGFPGGAYFLFLLLSAAYFSMMPAVLTDTFFTALFSAGLYFGLRAAARGSWPAAVAAGLLGGCAAQIRPALTVFPVANLLLQIAVARRHGVGDSRRVRGIIAASFALALLAGQAPALRNYANYGMYQSTDLIGSNLTSYLCRPLLHQLGRDDLYEKLTGDIAALPTIGEKVAFQKKYALELIAAHPLLLARHLLKNAAPTLLNNYWNKVGHYWGYHWAAEQPAAHMHLKQSSLLLLATGVWTAVYLVLTVFFLAFLAGLAQEREWVLLAGLALLVGASLLPGFVANNSPRLRLPLEGLIAMGAFQAAGAGVFRRLLARERWRCATPEGSR